MPGFVSPGLNGLRKGLLVSGMFEEFAFPSTAESAGGLLGVIAGPLALELQFSEFAVEVEDVHLHQFPRGEVTAALWGHAQEQGMGLKHSLGLHDLKTLPKIFSKAVLHQRAFAK